MELLTPSHRHLLLSEPPLPQLDPSACEERIISHEVKELGEHRSASHFSPLPSLACVCDCPLQSDLHRHIHGPLHWRRNASEKIFQIWRKSQLLFTFSNYCCVGLKLQVAKPLDVKTKFMNIEVGTGIWGGIKYPRKFYPGWDKIS